MDSGSPSLNIFDLGTMPATPMPNGRGETLRLVNTTTGTEKIDVHLNRRSRGARAGSCIATRNLTMSISSALARRS